MLPDNARMQESTAVPAVPDGLTEVRHHDGIYQWLNREQVARRERHRQGHGGHGSRKRLDVALSAAALLVVFLIAGVFVQCRVREAHSLAVPSAHVTPAASPSSAAGSHAP